MIYYNVVIIFYLRSIIGSDVVHVPKPFPISLYQYDIKLQYLSLLKRSILFEF